MKEIIDAEYNRKVGRPKLRSHPKELPVDPECPFLVGVEYYRPPVPPTRYWDEDFARIRAAGMRIVRSFPYWNWVEPAPEKFEFDDLDLFFELAAKHDLRVWLDIPVGTHGACPEWLIRLHPDMRVVWPDGSVQHPTAGDAFPQGIMIHNFDHPRWREYAGRYTSAVVTRYKDHPSLLVWGTWDGINFAAAWAGGEGYPPYNDYTIAKYIEWLKERFTLEQLNERLLRRYRCWEDVEPPRNNHALVEMTLYRQFHYENMADHLGWMADLIDRLDGKHEQRSHGGSFPKQWHEIVSPRIDSWGLSHSSAGELTGGDPYCIAERCFGYQWSRAIGRDGRWWNEEIHAGFKRGIYADSKQATPQEATVFLWLSLIEGAAGALYWQYRPEYMTFEAPGLNLTALDGTPTRRFAAVEKAIGQINSLAPHLPLTIPKADLAIAYSAPSMEIFYYANMKKWFEKTLRGVYRSLWEYSIPRDIVTPAMDWSTYKVIYLPNFAVLDEVTITKLRGVVQNSTGPQLVADGHFGSFAGKGHWSFCPPEGLSDLIDTRVEDFDMISPKDIRDGKNMLKTQYGDFAIRQPCQYAILKPGKNDRPIATLDGNVVGVQAANSRLMWFGVPLLVTGENRANSELTQKLFVSLGIGCPFSMQGDRLIAFRRQSRLGGSLVFLINLEHDIAKTSVKPRWRFESARDLLGNQDLTLKDRGFQVEIPFGEVCIVHCREC